MQHIQVRVPFTYRCEVLEPRKRNHTNLLFADYIDAEFPELIGIEAPIAAEWIDDRFNNGEQIETVHWRHWGGKFYKPSDWTLGELMKSMEGTANDRMIGHWGGHQTSLTYNQLIDEVGSPLDYREARTWSSDYDRQKAKALDFISDTISVDGSLYVSVPEPALFVKRSSSFRSDWVTVEVNEFGGREVDLDRDDSHHQVFRLNRLDEVQEYIATTPDYFGEAAEILSMPKLTIHQPEIFTFPDDLQMAIVCGNAVLRSVSRQPISELSDETIHQFMAFRQSLTDLKTSLDDNAIDTMLEEAQRLLETVTEGARYEQKMLDAIIKRMQMRVISPTFGL